MYVHGPPRSHVGQDRLTQGKRPFALSHTTRPNASAPLPQWHGPPPQCHGGPAQRPNPLVSPWCSSTESQWVSRHNVWRTPTALATPHRATRLTLRDACGSVAKSEGGSSGWICRGGCGEAGSRGVD